MGRSCLNGLALRRQFARANMDNLGIKPFTERIKAKRADKLVATYPHYNPRFVRFFADGEPLRWGLAIPKKGKN